MEARRSETTKMYRKMCQVGRTPDLFTADRPLWLTTDGLNLPAWKRLISHTITADERISLIMTIFSDYNQVEKASHLSGNDAQAFVDTIDEVRLCIISPPTNG